MTSGKTISDNIKKIRTKLGLTQDDLAKERDINMQRLQRSNNKGSSLVALLIILVLAAGTVTYIVVKKPLMFSFIEEKIKTIITPKPPIGDLTPSRDLRGTWVSSLSGKGMQLYGQFLTAGATTKVYENGDIELKIDKVENNIASGQIRYYNVCGYGETRVPDYGTVSVPKFRIKDTGFKPVQIRVSATSVDFGTISVGGVTATMQGSFTTDIMSGTMTTTTSYGVVKGEFHLIRKK